MCRFAECREWERKSSESKTALLFDISLYYLLYSTLFFPLNLQTRLFYLILGWYLFFWSNHISFFSYFLLMTICFLEGIFGFSLIFGGKCRLVERETAQCAENEAWQATENKSFTMSLTVFSPYRRVWYTVKCAPLRAETNEVKQAAEKWKKIQSVFILYELKIKKWRMTI